MNLKYHCVEILENKKESSLLHYVKTSKPKEYSFINGQYISAHKEGFEDTYFALASHPDDLYLEFLIKKSHHLAGEITSRGPGFQFNISSPQGPGFDHNKLKGQNILLITHGSGISAFLGLIKEIRNHRENYKSVLLLYGVRSPDEFPLKNTIREWMGSMEIYDIISQTPPDGQFWNGEIGHVQDILNKLNPKAEQTIALISGSDKMEQDVKKILSAMHFSANQIITNRS